MAFKMITLSEKEVGRIAGNAGAHAEMMATDLTLRWRCLIPEDQKYIDIHQMQMCVQHDLRQMRKEIADVEDRHLGNLELEVLSREVRDETIPQLRGQLMGIQDLFEGNFGAGTSFKVFGPQVSSIPVDPFPLRRVGKRAFRRLADPGFVLPVARLGGVEVVPADLAKGFEAPLVKLDLVLVELEDTLPISNRTLEEKIRTLGNLRKEALKAARFLEALYALARHEEISQRVRLSSHRPRRGTQPEPEGEQEATGESSERAEARESSGDGPTDTATPVAANDEGVETTPAAASADRAA